MKAVILAAGKSTRTYPLTANKPKPLLPVVNKEILAHSLDQLDGLVKEVVVIVGYEKDQIINRFGYAYGNISIKYVEQKEQKGTGHAIKSAEEHLNGRFIVMNGDDIYSKKDIEKCLEHNYCVLGQKVDDPSRFGVFVVENGKVKSLVEKPKEFVSDLANTGLYVLDEFIFDIDIVKSARGEFEIVDYINGLIEKGEDVYCEAVEEYWIPIAYPWNLLEANVHFVRNVKKDIKGEIEEGAVVKGEIVLGKGSVIKSGSYVTGPCVIGENCEIGPMCHIRGDVVIGDNCRIGKTEVFDAVIMNHTTSKHFGYIGHSVIGERVNAGAGLVTTDYRHDSAKHITLVNGNKVETGRTKLGAFIGDDVKTGVGTLIYPGRKIWPGKTTLPGEIVKEDIK